MNRRFNSAFFIFFVFFKINLNHILLFLLVTGVCCDVTTIDTSTGDPVWNIRHVLPDLDLANNNSVTDVKFNVGATAFLPCRFPRYSRHQENGVSWIRRWDWQILSAGIFMYTNDNRFAVLHREGSDDWMLQIKYVKLTDNGTYECQVHTGTSFLSHFVNLNVIQPRAVILGPEELHVRTGDQFSVTCVIEKVLSPPIHISWLHRNTTMNYAPGKPRLKISFNLEGIHTTSTMMVKDTKYEDSGNYTCSAPNAMPAVVRVFVTEGDTVAAVQRREMNNGGISYTSAHVQVIEIPATLLLLLHTSRLLSPS